MLSPFRMVCRDFILPEPASYVFFYAIFNLRNLLYIISLSFSGTKATCEVLVTADNYMDDIYLEIELWRGSVKIEDWTVSGEGFIDFSKTASVAKGNTYTLKVYAEINNVEITPVSLTKTYR